MRYEIEAQISYLTEEVKVKLMEALDEKGSDYVLNDRENVIIVLKER